MNGVRPPVPRWLLASAGMGLVLGVGATVTSLAAWTSHQYVWGGTGATGAQPGQSGGGVTTSKFTVEISPDGTNFADQSSAPGQQLSFSATAGALSPGVTTYAWAALRVASGSTVGGSVTLNGASAMSGTDPALFAALTYGAKSGVSQSDCAAANYAQASGATQLVPAGSALTTASAANVVTLAAPASANAAGAPVGVCFALTLPQGASATLSGRTTTPVWDFSALSN